MAKILKTDNIKYKDVEQLEFADTAGRNVKQYSHFDKLFDNFLGSLTHTDQVTQEFLSQIPAKENICTHSFFKNCYMDVYSSLIHKSPKLKTTQMQFKKKKTVPCNNIVESLKHYPENKT